MSLKKLRKIFLIVSLAVMMVLVVTACGSKDDDEYDEYEDYEEDYEEYEEETDEDLLEALRKATASAHLPAPEDALEQEISMPSYEKLVIGYPKQMTAQADENDNAVTFYSTEKQGTFDDYALFTVIADELDEAEQVYIDSLMSQGPGVANHYMAELAAMYMRGIFLDYSMDAMEGISFFDDQEDSYVYARPVVVWDCGFEDEPEDMYGCIYLKYTGTAGYLLVGCAIAPEERADAYLNLGARIMCGISDDADFSTGSYAKTISLSAAPDDRPKDIETDKASENTAGGANGAYLPQMELAVHENAFFWADSKGNCWFFDGDKDVFWSDSAHGSIDEKTGKWTEAADYEWEDLMYSDYLGDNAEDDFSFFYDALLSDDYDDDYGDADADDSYEEEYNDDEEEWSDDEEDYDDEYDDDEYDDEDDEDYDDDYYEDDEDW